MKGWFPAYAESTPRIEKKYSGGNGGRGRAGRINYLVVLADAGTHTSWQGWIPAFAGMTEGGWNEQLTPYQYKTVATMQHFCGPKSGDSNTFKDINMQTLTLLRMYLCFPFSGGH